MEKCFEDCSMLLDFCCSSYVLTCPVQPSICDIFVSFQVWILSHQRADCFAYQILVCMCLYPVSVAIFLVILLALILPH